VRPALVLIDLQEDYLARPPIDARRDALCARIADLLAAFRERGLPVLHVVSVYKADRSNWTRSMLRDEWSVVIEGTRGADVPPVLRPEAGEPVIVKDRYSAFFRTDFEARLAESAADALVVVGINTHACVRMTVIDAFMRDWAVIVPVDCVDSWDAEHHRVTLAYFDRGIAALTTAEALRLAIAEGRAT
jgi:nicotinamidase-related amidase